MSILVTIGDDKISEINRYSIFIVLVLAGCQLSTIAHEYGHAVVALALGYCVSISIGFKSGTTFVYGEIDPTAMAIIAVAGSATLIVIGMTLVLARTCPVVAAVFLGRAWLDMLPIFDYDGAIIARTAGMNIAIALLFAEIVLCAYGLGKIKEVQDIRKKTVSLFSFFRSTKNCEVKKGKL